VAIETALSLRLLLHLPLRQTGGFLRSIFELMNLTLDVPDHTTLSRRSASVDDPATGIILIDEVNSKIKTVIADGAYDTRASHASAETRGARVVVPPDKTATIGGELSRDRDRAVRRIRKVGRRQWKAEVGYHQQARAENAFFRFKTILGDRMRARGSDAQSLEARIACNILNKLTELGRPESNAIGR